MLQTPAGCLGFRVSVLSYIAHYTTMAGNYSLHARAASLGAREAKSQERNEGQR